MKLLGSRLLVEPITFTQTTGGIHLPGSLTDDPNMGGVKQYRVLAVGPGRVTKRGARVPVEASPGDRVLTHSYFKGPVDAGEGKLIITEDEVVAVLPKAKVKRWPMRWPINRKHKYENQKLNVPERQTRNSWTPGDALSQR